MHKPAPRDKIWTPHWVAMPMAEYVLADHPAHILDPAVGNGALLKAAKTIAEQAGFSLTCYGTEIDPDILSQAGLSDDLIALADFLSYPFQNTFSAIIANPPYIRHHYLAPEAKSRLQKLAHQITGNQLDGRAGLHVYFLIRALSLLSDGGRLAFIVPADVCEGKFANRLWRWITTHFALEAIVTFAPSASPFPQADVNPVILLIRNTHPSDTFYWAKCICAKPWSARQWLTEHAGDDLIVTRRSLAEGVATGLSRPPSSCLGRFYRLVDFCRVVRGVASGANDFFFLAKARAAQIGIPEDYLVPAIVRTRDISGDEITTETIAALDRRGRPTSLLSIHPNAHLPPPILAYLRSGERQGLPQRPLIAQRKPWYKTETRTPPPLLFAYLGRRRPRFIRNRAGVVPSSSFLCVYPNFSYENYIDTLWHILNHPNVLANIPLVAKTYGGGALKVEPRALEQLPIPAGLIEQSELPVPNTLC